MLIFDYVLLVIYDSTLYAWNVLNNETALQSLDDLSISAPRMLYVNEDVYPNMLFVDNSSNLLIL